MPASAEDKCVPIHPCLHVEVTVKVKANMQFKKIFEVAEVIVLPPPRKPYALIVPLFQKRFGKDPGALPSTFAKHKLRQP